MRLVLSFFFLFCLTIQGDSGQNKETKDTSIADHIINLDKEDHDQAMEVAAMSKEFNLQAKHYYAETDGHLSLNQVKHLIKESQGHDVPIDIVLKLLKTESNFDESLIGPETVYGHAYGMAQFMKNTAPWVAEMADLEYEFEKLFDPYYSITLAVTYLHYLQYGDDKRHEGYENWHTSLTAYHRGISGMETYRNRNNTTISKYSHSIINQDDFIVYQQ